MNKIKFVKIDGQLYEIDTDFRVALECNTIAKNKKIGDCERGLAIIYKLFGKKGLECKNQKKLLELGLQYLWQGKKENEEQKKVRDKNELDFTKCVGLIKSSFKYDYNYDPYELEYLHWYDFYNDLCNLSTSEFGNCCILNRIANILNQDVNQIKDSLERDKVNKAQIELREKYCVEQEIEMTKEEEKSVEEFYKALGVNV